MPQDWQRQMRKGLAELCVLLAVAKGETYGYAILSRLSRLQGLGFSESTLYPVLARLSEQGFLAVREAPSPYGPRRRYYRLTQAGERHLEALKHTWRLIRDGIDDLTGETVHDDTT